MSRQTHRTCIRMSEKGYQRLKHLSCAAGLSANAWLMKELEGNRPTLYRVEQTGEVIRFMDAAGRGPREPSTSPPSVSVPRSSVSFCRRLPSATNFS